MRIVGCVRGIGCVGGFDRVGGFGGVGGTSRRHGLLRPDGRHREEQRMEAWWTELGMDLAEVGMTVVATVGLYLVTIVASRVLGQRQFSTLSSYDLAFTFALGAIVGRGVLVKPSALNAAVALVLMFALHAGVGWLHHNVGTVHLFTQNSPILVVAHGQVMQEALGQAGMSSVELHQLLRGRGHGSLQDVGVAILEPNGHLSVITADTALSPRLLEGVEGAGHVLSE